MKRRELLRHLQQHGCSLLREGGRHSWWINPVKKRRSAIPRHTEIDEYLARKNLQRSGCAESVCSLFEKTMRINNRLSGFFSRQTIEQFHQARLVRIAHGRFATWLDPFGVLNPEVVVNLLPELHVGMDLMMQGRWPGERFICGPGWFVQLGFSMSALPSKTNEFHKRLSIWG